MIQTSRLRVSWRIPMPKVELRPWDTDDSAAHTHIGSRDAMTSFRRVEHGVF
jgi:hypothetical protein